MPRKKKLPEVQLISWFNEHWYPVPDALIPEVREPKYLLDGKPIFPSSTTILGILEKPYLRRWYGDLGTREAEYRSLQARIKGSNVHEAVRVLKTGGIVLYEPPIKAVGAAPQWSPTQIKKLKKQFHGNLFVVREQDDQVQIERIKLWHEVVKPRALGTEFTVFSTEHQYAGTIDLPCVIDEGEYAVSGSKPIKLESGVWIVDYKTGGTFDEDGYMQVASYALAWEERMRTVKNTYTVCGTLIVHSNAPQVRAGIEGLKTHVRTREQVQGDFEDFLAAKKLWERKRPTALPSPRKLASYITMNGFSMDQIGRTKNEQHAEEIR